MTVSQKMVEGCPPSTPLTSVCPVEEIRPLRPLELETQPTRIVRVRPDNRSPVEHGTGVSPELAERFDYFVDRHAQCWDCRRSNRQPERKYGRPDHGEVALVRSFVPTINPGGVPLTKALTP